MKRKILMWMFVLVLCSWSAFGYLGGDGSPGSPYLISNCNELDDVDSDCNSGPGCDEYYRLNNSFSCSGFGNFDPIGDDSDPFDGVFDG